MSKCAFQFTEDGDRTAVYWSAGIAAAMRSVYNLIHSIRQWEWIGQTHQTITPGITSPTLLQHCVGSQLNVPLLSHTSIKPGRLLSGLTLFSGHLSESQKLCQSFHVKKTSIKRQRPPPCLLDDRLRIKRTGRVLVWKLCELCSDLRISVQVSTRYYLQVYSLSQFRFR